mgnify:CR=1 FL=1
MEYKISSESCWLFWQLRCCIVHFFFRQTTESKIFGNRKRCLFFYGLAAVGMIAYQKFLLKKVQNKLDKRATFGEREYGFDQDGVMCGLISAIANYNGRHLKIGEYFKDYIYLTTIAEQRILVRRMNCQKKIGRII